MSHQISLETIIDSTILLKQVRKKDIRLGDTVYIITQNSTYMLTVLGINDYIVSGGWFDQTGVSPKRISINGCTWGGTTIKKDILAACGLNMEFDNCLRTSKVMKVLLLKGNYRN